MNSFLSIWSLLAIIKVLASKALASVPPANGRGFLRNIGQRSLSLTAFLQHHHHYELWLGDLACLLSTVSDEQAPMISSPFVAGDDALSKVLKARQ
jgi:hypothetical protein